MKSNYMNNKWYWAIRGDIDKSLFRFKKWHFQFKQKITYKKYGQDFSKLIILHILKQLFLCFLILLTLYLFDHVVNYLLITKYQIIKKVCVDSSLASDFLTIGVSVSGIFLGLYFANMATVYSSRYANAPKNVRTLFENDFVTNKNINSIIRYIILLSGILLLNIISLTPGYITLAIAFLYTAKIIVSFALIGRRIFGFSDVYEIASQVYYEIVKNIQACKYSSRLSTDINFQAHYLKTCERQFSYLYAINQFNLENRSLKSGSMLDFMNNNLAVLKIYWEAKTSIPYDSEWFKMKQVYKKWYLASDTEVSLAINAGINMSTSKERDYVWFEDYIFKINNDCLKRLIQDEKFEYVTSYFSLLSNVIPIGVSIGETDYVINQINETRMLISQIPFKEDSIPDNGESAMIDNLMLIYASICLQIFNDLNTSPKIIKELEKISAKCSFKIINFNSVSFLNKKQIQEFLNGIISEEKTMGKRITPRWYIDQKIFGKYNDFINNQMNTVDRIINEDILEWGNHLVDSKRYSEAMIVLSRITELNAKFRFFEKAIHNTFDNVNSKRKEQSLPWKTFNFDLLNQHCHQSYMKLPQLWSKASVAFSLVSNNKQNEYPDMLGYSYNHIGELLMEAIEKNDFELFEAGYNSYFGISMIYQDIIRADLLKQGLESQTDAKIRVIANPILEFCTISGMSILWGELNNNRCWVDIVMKIVTDFKTPEDRHKQIFENWIKIIQLTEHLSPALYNRDLIQTNWEQRFSNAICSMKSIEYEEIGWGNKQIKTDSPLVKAYLRGNDLSLGFGLKKLYDIYLIRCINPLIDSSARYKSRSNWEEDIDFNE